MQQQQRGVLLHVSSLSGGYGIGSLGAAAYRFVDFLAQSSFTMWQVLPLCPTSYGDSPYQSPSAFAGNPYFIDLDLLLQQGLLTPSDLSECGEIAYSVQQAGTEKIDYEALYNRRYKTLRRAYKKFSAAPTADYADFLALQKEWLSDYALFMALKVSEEMRAFCFWPERKRNYVAAKQLYCTESCQSNKADAEKGESVEEIKQVLAESDFWRFTQYLFFKQWAELKSYANNKGVRIVGDMPIYVAYDSVDVWSAPRLFQLKKNLTPKSVAGVPPDAFSDSGQLWGNPLYNWAEMKRRGYDFWIRRIRAALSLYDFLRIDHFRGFADYWAVPYNSLTAAAGKWRRGPDYALFKAVKREIPNAKILAEDLGQTSDKVVKLMQRTEYPGMRIYQFGFGSNEKDKYLPENYDGNCIAYTGTHDNETTVGWFNALNPLSKSRILQLLKAADSQYPHAGKIEANKEDMTDANSMRKVCEQSSREPLTAEETTLPATELVDKMIYRLFCSSAQYALVPMQDLLGLGNEARMNTPSTCTNNWVWRLQEVPNATIVQKARCLLGLNQNKY